MREREREGERGEEKERESWFLDFNILSAPENGVRTSQHIQNSSVLIGHTVQVLRPQVKSWLTVLDTTESTAKKKTKLKINRKKESRQWYFYCV